MTWHGCWTTTAGVRDFWCPLPKGGLRATAVPLGTVPDSVQCYRQKPCTATERLAPRVPSATHCIPSNQNANAQSDVPVPIMYATPLTVYKPVCSPACLPASQPTRLPSLPTNLPTYQPTLPARPPADPMTCVHTHPAGLPACLLFYLLPYLRFYQGVLPHRRVMELGCSICKCASA